MRVGVLGSQYVYSFKVHFRSQFTLCENTTETKSLAFIGIIKLLILDTEHHKNTVVQFPKLVVIVHFPR